MPEQAARRIAPAEGKLGVLCVGLGAVATTFIAGVENVRRGGAKPIGSLTQMGTIRLGKRTDDNVPLIKDYVPLAGLDDLVFGGWDVFPDDAYVAAARAELEARGVEFKAETIDSGVCHQAIFEDPDGNSLDLHHRYAPRKPAGG